MKTFGIDISVLTNPHRTGIAVYVYELVKAILKLNKRDKFILFGLSPFAAFENLNSLEFKNYPNTEMKLFKMPAKAFRFIFLLWEKINWPPIEYLAGPLDIFHSFNWFLPPQKKGKIVTTVFDLTPTLYPYWHQERTVQLEKIRLQRISEMSDCVIAISENSKKDLLKLYPKLNVKVIYPAASEKFTSQVDSNKIDLVLKKYHLREDFILSVGTLEPRKNLPTLISAYLKSNLSNELVLVGDLGWKNESILAKVKKSEKIKMMGFIPDEDLVILYQHALCLVYPSFYEGFGLPVLEAMSCGTPVICSKTSSLPEVAGCAAVYIDPNSINDIVKALRRIQNRQLRKRLTEKGLAQAKNFSWEKSAKKLNDLYQAL